METTTDASDNWKIVEQNTKESFRLCKNDIINFGIQLAKVQQAQRDLAEQVGELKDVKEHQHDLENKLETVKGKTGKVDLAGVYNRVESVEHAMDKLRENKLDHSAIQKELKVMQQRYDELVGITKNLMRIMQERKAEKQKVKIIHTKPKIIRKIVHTRPKIIKIARKREWVASTATMKVHRRHCPFAMNIKKANKKVFKSRLVAFKNGFKACKCMK